MKPRILILIHYMELGGAESALIGLLHALDLDKVDVDLFIHSHRGEMMKFIPVGINLLSEIPSYSMIERPIMEVIKKGQYAIAWGRLRSKILHRRHVRSGATSNGIIDASEFQYVADCVEPYLPKINPSVNYDLCISFLAPHNYAIKKVRAKKKIAWIHTDYSTIHVNVEQELPVWMGFDKIVSISPQVTESFLKVFPSLKDKILDSENIIPATLIKSRAQERCDLSMFSEGINLLSIGRFCTAKNYDNVPDIARRIIQLGIKDIKWYIIGYGYEEIIRSKIAESAMEDHVIILGKKSNPYPYIKACDIYVQPSRYEGKSITVREAQILGKPVVVTAYPTASSQIKDGEDGVIVPLDNQGCAEGIAAFIKNKDLQNKIIANLAKGDFANVSEVDKIYELLK